MFNQKKQTFVLFFTIRKVFLAELVGHGQYFAIKCLKKNVVIEDNDVESTMIERKVLALGSSNPYICKLFCTFQTPVSDFYFLNANIICFEKMKNLFFSRV